MVGSDGMYSRPPYVERCAKCSNRDPMGGLDVTGQFWLCNVCIQFQEIRIERIIAKKVGSTPNLSSENAVKRHIRSQACAYCGAPPPSTIDHYFPKSRGGRNHISNYRPACQDCNQRKGDMMPDDWEALLRRERARARAA